MSGEKYTALMGDYNKDRWEEIANSLDSRRYKYIIAFQVACAKLTFGVEGGDNLLSSI